MGIIALAGGPGFAAYNHLFLKDWSHNLTSVTTSYMSYINMHAYKHSCTQNNGEKICRSRGTWMRLQVWRSEDNFVNSFFFIFYLCMGFGIKLLSLGLNESTQPVSYFSCPVWNSLKYDWTGKTSSNNNQTLDLTSI